MSVLIGPGTTALIVIPFGPKSLERTEEAYNGVMLAIKEQELKKKELEQKIKRGQPKTFDRDHVLNTVMFLYWREGVSGVTICEICERANVSKPSLYREFGNDDGLMRSVLEFYKKIY